MKKRGCVTIGLWFLFFPIMFTIWAARKKKPVFYILAGLIWLIAIALYISSSLRAKTPEYQQTRTAAAIENSWTSTPKPTATPSSFAIKASQTAEARLWTATPTATLAPTVSLETMPGIESWDAAPFYEAFLKITGFPAPEEGQGEEGVIHRALGASNDQYEMDYHTTENAKGKVAEAFFNVTGKNASGILGEVATLSAVGRDYQNELRDWVNGYSGIADIEKNYGDGWYKVTSNGDDVYMLIIHHVQYNDYLRESSTL